MNRHPFSRLLPWLIVFQEVLADQTDGDFADFFTWIVIDPDGNEARAAFLDALAAGIELEQDDFSGDLEIIRNHGPFAAVAEKHLSKERAQKLLASPDFLRAACQAFHDAQPPSVNRRQDTRGSRGRSNRFSLAADGDLSEEEELQQFHRRSLRYAKSRNLRASHLCEDDVAQEATLKAQRLRSQRPDDYQWSGLNSLCHRMTLQTYVRKLQRKIDTMTSSYSASEESETLINTDTVNPLDEVSRAELVSILHEHLCGDSGLLSENEREILRMHFFEDKKQREIAETGIARNQTQVHRILARTLRKLRDAFGGDDFKIAS